MLTRSAGYDNAQYTSLWHSLIHHRNPDTRNYSGFQCISFWQDSLPSARVDRYFLINQKNKLLIAGDDLCPDMNIRDVRAEWLGLPANFHGFMGLQIRQKQLGCIFSYYIDLGLVTDIGLLKGTWFDFRLPVLVIDNTARVCQSGIVNAPPPSQPVHDIITAFNPPNWCFGRIAGTITHIRPGDLRIDWGKTFLAEDHFEIGCYSSLSLPVGNKQDARYLFAPFTGSNGHVGIGGGVFFQIPLNIPKNNDVSFCFFLNLDGLALFKNRQYRTFDLKNKKWSRYMLYVIKNSLPGNPIPGVNLLTFETRVRPYCFADFTTGWRYISQHTEGEIGFNIWGHPTERLRVDEAFAAAKRVNNVEFGIAGQGALNPDAAPECQVAATAHCSTINYLAPNDPLFVSVQQSDIDLKSAAAKKTITFKIHGSWGGIAHGTCVDAMFGGGFFTEFTHSNSSLSRWGIWAKVGAVIS
jgi:hypothetical protein